MAFGKYDLKMKAGFTLSSFALLLKFLAPMRFGMRGCIFEK
jgi:hypothetical protein